MVETAKELVNRSLGKNGLGRDILHQMKKDIYGKEIDMSKLWSESQLFEIRFCCLKQSYL